MAKEEVIMDGLYFDRSEEDMRKIASDLHAGIIFSDRHLSPLEFERDMGLIFMPIMFWDKAMKDKVLADPPGMVFEYLSKASPRSVNGKPTFFSCHLVSQKDTKRIFEYLEDIVEAEKSVGLKTPVPKTPGAPMDHKVIAEHIVRYCTGKEEEIAFEFDPPLHPDSTDELRNAEHWEFVGSTDHKGWVDCDFRCRPFKDAIIASVKMTPEKDRVLSIKVGD